MFSKRSGRLVRWCGILAALALPTAGAFAQTSDYAGTITRVFVSNGSNYAYRVSLANGSTDPLSGCTFDFAYVNTSYDNYAALVAQLMTNYANQKPVMLRVVMNSGGTCQIIEAGG